MEVEKHQNTVGKPYSGEAWLDAHHSIKSRLRAELVHNLPVEPGCKVLDVGCGTGIWSMLFAERVGHRGGVVGIDIDPDAIKLAEQRKKSHYLGREVQFLCSDISSIDASLKFDVIVVFNSMSYMRDPEEFLGGLPSRLEKNGSILIKDSDIGSDFLWPVDIDLYNSLISSIYNAKDLNSKKYDAFFARKIPALLHRSRFKDIKVTSQSYSFCHPVDSKERNYISTNGKIIADFAAEAGAVESAKEWVNQFKDGDSSIFNKKEFLYTMTEFLFHARAPESS